MALTIEQIVKAGEKKCMILDQIDRINELVAICEKNMDTIEEMLKSTFS